MTAVADNLITVPTHSEYASFLGRKKPSPTMMGITIPTTDFHEILHGWQKEIVQWACQIGRAAIWADTGLGKTLMQLEWANKICDGVRLVVAPLAVCEQTVRESEKLGLKVSYIRDGESITPGIYVTNYEMVPKFKPNLIDAVVLDESSILKQSDGSTRNLLINHFKSVKYRLACTATPAPNDPEELTSQAEFLGYSSRVNMLASYFVHDADGWRVKGHAWKPMFRWMATWAIAIRKPSDMGHVDDGYILPGLEIIHHSVHSDLKSEGDFFFNGEIGGVGGRAKIRKETMQDRCNAAVEIVTHEPNEPWVLWCGLNDEALALQKIIPGSVNVHGSLSPDEKAKHLLDFSDGKVKYLITKPSIASMGLNWQHCCRMVFVGLSDSYEAYYQCIRRCYRYGQRRIVHAHIVLSEAESVISENVLSKEQEFSKIIEEMVISMRDSKR